MADRKQNNDENYEPSGPTGSGSSETDIVKNGAWLQGSVTVCMGFIPPELLGWHWAADLKVGELPDHEWARADLLRPNDLHGSRLRDGAPNRCVATPFSVGDR